MEEKRIPCEMIQDLMPLYLDGLTSDKTNNEIEKHMKECGACSEKYGYMREDVAAEGIKRKTSNEREIDYLKKVRAGNHKKIAISILGTLLAIGLAVFLKLFVIGYPVDSYSVTYTNVNGEQVNVGGIFYDSASAYKGYRLEKQRDGSTKLIVYGCLPTPWRKEGAFNLEFNLGEAGERADINGITIEKDGTVITKLANDLFSAKNPYIGDMPANGKIAQLLGMAGKLGSYTNELQTSREPYEWTLKFEEGITNSALFEAEMKKYACVLTALIDNLGIVNWTYTVETEAGPVTRKSSLTRPECEEYVGDNVEAFSDSPKDMQHLLDILGLGE